MKKYSMTFIALAAVLACSVPPAVNAGGSACAINSAIADDLPVALKNAFVPAAVAATQATAALLDGDLLNLVIDAVDGSDREDTAGQERR